MKYVSGGVTGSVGQALEVEVPTPAGVVAVTLNGTGGKPASGISWQLTLPDGSVRSGKTGSNGRIAVDGVPSGDCKLVLPDLDGAAASGGDPAQPAPAQSDAPAQSGQPAPADQAQQSGQPAPADQPAQPPANQTAAQKRQAILAKAREYVGKIDPRAGPDGKKIGWELLKDIHDTSFCMDIFQDPAAKEKLPAPHQMYCSWCGVFALAMAKKSGVVPAEVKWNPGGKITGGLDKIQGQVDGIQPGDIIIMPLNNLWHHAIVTAVDGDVVSTLDGNSFDPATFQDQSVVEHTRNRKKSDISHWYKTVADDGSQVSDAPPAGQQQQASPQPQPQPQQQQPPQQQAPAPSDEQKAPDPTGQILRHDDPRLSDHRKKLLAELDKRLPSSDGATPGPGKINLFEGVQKQPAGTTSCGLLPTVLMAFGMGVKASGDVIFGVFGYGTEGVKEQGRKHGAWVENDGTALPQPGDVYCLRYEDDPEGDRVSHVGIIVDVDPNDGSTWTTGDSGQDNGEVRGAKYCSRAMKKQDGTHVFLKGEYTAALRRVGGWVDLDKLMAAIGK